MTGGVVRLLRCWPGVWEAHAMAPNGASQLLETAAAEPSYKVGVGRGVVLRRNIKQCRVPRARHVTLLAIASLLCLDSPVHWYDRFVGITVSLESGPPVAVVQDLDAMIRRGRDKKLDIFRIAMEASVGKLVLRKPVRRVCTSAATVPCGMAAGGLRPRVAREARAQAGHVPR